MCWGLSRTLQSTVPLVTRMFLQHRPNVHSSQTPSSSRPPNPPGIFGVQLVRRLPSARRHCAEPDNLRELPSLPLVRRSIGLCLANERNPCSNHQFSQLRPSIVPGPFGVVALHRIKVLSTAEAIDLSTSSNSSFRVIISSVISALLGSRRGKAGCLPRGGRARSRSPV